MLHTPTISNCEPAQPAPAGEAVAGGRLDAPPVEPVPQVLRMMREPSRNFRLPPCNLNMNSRAPFLSSVLVPIAGPMTARFLSQTFENHSLHQAPTIDLLAIVSSRACHSGLRLHLLISTSAQPLKALTRRV